MSNNLILIHLLQTIIAGVIGILFLHQVIARIISRHYHFPIPIFLVRYIDNPLLRLVQPPKKVVDWIEIEEGMNVLEIGPGTGTFTIEASKIPFSDKIFNRVFLVRVLGEVPDKKAVLIKINRVLKDDGILAIGESLPDPDYPRTKTTINWCKYSGFEVVTKYSGYLHYLLTLKN